MQRTFVDNPRLIQDILYLDRPDLVVTSGRPEEPIIALEYSEEAPSGHDVFQRFARIVAAAELGIPFAYVFPGRKWVTRRGSERWDQVNPLIFRALFQVARFHNVPVLSFLWPSSDDGDPAKGKLLHDDKYIEQPPRDHPEMQELWRFVNLAIEFYQSKRPFSEMGLTPYYGERERCMWKHYIERGAADREWSPLTQCNILPTDNLHDYIQEYLPREVPSWPAQLAARQETIIYQTHSKTFARDPYGGCLVAIDYLCCREGPTREHRYRNLCVHFPKASIAQIVSKCQYYHSNKCPLRRDYTKTRPDQYLTLHLRDGCRYTKQKELRTTCFFADMIILKDAIIY